MRRRRGPGRGCSKAEVRKLDAPEGILSLSGLGHIESIPLVEGRRRDDDVMMMT